MDNAPPYVIEMLHITKEFPGIKANDDITLQLKKGEIHALLGENGAGKSTLMSVLFGLYQPEAGEIRKNGKPVKIDNPNDATALGIGMVHQHFKLIDVFTVLDNIILGAETTKLGFIQRKEARKKVEELSEKYGLKVDLDAKVEDITVGMQQRVEILKMLYRDNEILIFDEPTAVLTPQEIDELMATMKEFAREGKSILFISHKLNEIMAVADRVTVLRKGKCIGTVNTCDTNKQELSNMMVGRPVQLVIDKTPAHPGEEILHVEDLCVLSHLHKRNAVDHVSFSVRAGEIVCIAGIDGNGQTELIHGLTGLDNITGGPDTLCGETITHASIRRRGRTWCSSATRSRSSSTAASSAATPCAPTPTGSLSSSTSAAARAPSRSRAACPAATSRRPSSPARSTATNHSSSPCSPRAALTSARSNTSTSSSSPSATRARPCCSCRSSSTRS